MTCKTHKSPKKLPYGATKGNYWCWGCDAMQVPEWYGPQPKKIKSKAREKAKKEIRKELKRIGK